MRGMKDWLAQAWHDWIRPLGVLIVAGLAYLGYRFELLGESVAGIGLVVAIVAGTVGVAVVPAWGMARRSSQRAQLVVLSGLALVGAGWPSLRAAIATRPLATARLTAAQPSA